MNITEIHVIPVNEERLKAYVTIVLEACFIVRDIKVIHGNKGLFVAMPNKKKKDGTYQDIAHPLNKETRVVIETQVLEAYQKEMANPTPRHQRRDPSEEMI